jgi:hypothetical protein
MRGRTGSTVFVRNYGRYHRLRHAGKWCPRSAIGAPAANLQQKLSLRLKCPVRPDGGFDGPSGSFSIAVALALSLVGFGEIPSAIGTSFVQPRSVAGSAVGRKLAIRMWQFPDHDYRNSVPFTSVSVGSMGAQTHGRRTNSDSGPTVCRPVFRRMLQNRPPLCGELAVSAKVGRA